MKVIDTEIEIYNERIEIAATRLSKYIDNKDLEVRYVNKFLGLLAFEIWYRMFITKEMNDDEKLKI